jgi:hypothetical protein
MAAHGANGGDRLPPVQPTRFRPYSFDKLGPSLVSGLTSENESLGTAIDVDITVAGSDDTTIRLAHLATPGVPKYIALPPIPCSIVSNRKHSLTSAAARAP